MTVQIRVGLAGIEIVGRRDTYREALDLAIRTLRQLESVPIINPNQWVEILEGQSLRMSAQVGRR
jgi:hypothetical protein